jgi:hypothetical protein
MKKVKHARFKQGTLEEDGREIQFKCWLTVCPFCYNEFRHAEETNKAGFYETAKHVACEHARYTHDDGQVEFVK